MADQVKWPILTTDLEPFLTDLDDAFENGESSVEHTKAWMRTVLHRFEERYGMTSQEFYTRWLQNGIQDTYETTFWATLCRYQQWLGS